MSALIVDGKGIASAVLTNLKTQLDALSEPLHLAAVCAGDDPGLKSFVRLKQKAAESVGVVFSSYFFDADDQDGAMNTLKFLAVDEAVQGIFIELPLPAGWDVGKMIALVPPEKDVDAFHGTSVVNEPTVVALEHVLTEYAIQVPGMPVCVVGQGRLVGAPITRWLKSQGAQVAVIDKDTANPAALAHQARMIVTGVGKAGLITGDWIGDDAIVIDFGFPGGDVDAESVAQKAALLTPVPGGMGPLLIASVLENLLALATQV